MIENVSVWVAFSAGFLSFFAPCVIPLIPPYFAWLLGVGEGELSNKRTKLKIFLHGLILIFGFSIAFIILGASASKIGRYLLEYRLLLQKIGGILIILFGLQFIGFLRLFKKYQIRLSERLFKGLGRQASSLVVGLVFAFAWVACFSPILGSLLVLSAFQDTLRQGVTLLTFYSLGLAVPFLLAALFAGFLIEKAKFIRKAIKWINLFSGTLLIILGILLFFDKFYKIVVWVAKII